MSKYGWTKGQGLGATNSGIINPLRVQVEKQPKKKSGGADGGGWLGDGATAPRTTGSSSRGKIIGGKKRKGDNDEEGQFGRMSEVVVLRGMVDGLDLDAEMHSTGDNGGSGGGLMQEIGEECSEKVGHLHFRSLPLSFSFADVWMWHIVRSSRACLHPPSRQRR